MAAREQHVWDDIRWRAPGVRSLDAFTAVGTATANSYFLSDPPSAVAAEALQTRDITDAISRVRSEIQRTSQMVKQLTVTEANTTIGAELLRTRVLVAMLTVISWMAGAPDKRGAVGKRLRELINAIADDPQDAHVPNQVVLSAVFKFFDGDRGLSRPSITLTPPGGVWAQWRQGRERAAALHFTGDGVNLIATVPRPRAMFGSVTFADSLNWQLALQRMQEDPLLAWTHAPAGG